MNEEYDVIVLGTGLTVLSHSDKPEHILCAFLDFIFIGKAREAKPDQLAT